MAAASLVSVQSGGSTAKLVMLLDLALMSSQHRIRVVCAARLLQLQDKLPKAGEQRLTS